MELAKKSNGLHEDAYMSAELKIENEPEFSTGLPPRIIGEPLSEEEMAGTRHRPVNGEDDELLRGLQNAFAETSLAIVQALKDERQDLKEELKSHREMLVAAANRKPDRWPAYLGAVIVALGWVGNGIYVARGTEGDLRSQVAVLTVQIQSAKEVREEMQSRMDAQRKEFTDKVDLNNAYITTLITAMSRAGVRVPDRK